MRMVFSPQMIGHGERPAEPVDAATSPMAGESVIAETPAVVETPETATPAPAAPRLDPTRYGDWERNGRCIDF